MVREAEREGAPPDVLQALRALPPVDYANGTEVARSAGIDAAPGGGPRAARGAGPGQAPPAGLAAPARHLTTARRCGAASRRSRTAHTPAARPAPVMGVVGATCRWHCSARPRLADARPAGGLGRRRAELAGPGLARLWPMDAERTARLAVHEDPNRAMRDALLLAACLASLLAVGVVLATAHERRQPGRPGRLRRRWACSAWCCPGSWCTPSSPPGTPGSTTPAATAGSTSTRTSAALRGLRLRGVHGGSDVPGLRHRPASDEMRRAVLLHCWCRTCSARSSSP